MLCNAKPIFKVFVKTVDIFCSGVIPLVELSLACSLSAIMAEWGYMRLQLKFSVSRRRHFIRGQYIICEAEGEIGR